MLISCKVLNADIHGNVPDIFYCTVHIQADSTFQLLINRFFLQPSITSGKGQRITLFIVLGRFSSTLSVLLKVHQLSPQYVAGLKKELLQS